MIKNIFFEFFKWIFKLINITFISIFVILIILFLTDLIHQLPILKSDIKYDPISISNTFIVYVTFIFVIGTIALTLAGFYFQKSIAKREGEILNENMEKVLDAITTDKDQFREKLVTRILEHNKIKPLIQERLDKRVRSFENDLHDYMNDLKEVKESLATLGNGFNELSSHIPVVSNITFDLPETKDK